MPQDKSHDWHPCLTSGCECKRKRFALWYSFTSAIFFIMKKLVDTYCMSKLDLEHQVKILYERLIGKLWGGQLTKLQEGFQALHLLWSEVILPTPSQNTWRMTSTGRQKWWKHRDWCVTSLVPFLYLQIFYSHIKVATHAGKCQTFTAKSCGCCVRYAKNCKKKLWKFPTIFQ